MDIIDAAIIAFFFFCFIKLSKVCKICAKFFASDAFTLTPVAYPPLALMRALEETSPKK